MDISTFDLDPLKGQGQGQAHFDCKYLENGESYGKQTLLLPTNRMPHTLQLTLAYSKGQGQCHVHFDWEYL